MKLYLVRHGMTDDWAKGLHQSRSSVLSAEGIKQAEALADRFKNINFDKIICSTYERARETAEIINTHHNKQLVEDDLVTEIKRPSSVEGKSYYDTKVTETMKLVREHFLDKEYHQEDGENFYDVLKRARTFIDKLQAENNESILVVSHGAYMKIVILAMIFEDDIAASIFNDFYERFDFMNTGITLCERSDKWRLLTWNDHAHLG